MKDLIDTLETEFSLNANKTIASQQEAYMRNQFMTYGIKTNDRRKIQNPFLVKAFLPPKQELESIVKSLWDKPQREFQYFGQ
ncbi:MAG: DNA alkylation repair protein, partial [Olleya sp.]